MPTLYSSDEMRNARQIEISDEVEAIRLHNIVKGTQNHKPGIAKWIFDNVRSFMAVTLGRIECFVAKHSAALFRDPDPEVKPC